MRTNEATNRESCGRVHIGEPTTKLDARGDTTHGGMASECFARIILRIPSALTPTWLRSWLPPEEGRVEESGRLSRVKTSRVEPSPVSSVSLDVYERLTLSVRRRCSSNERFGVTRCSDGLPLVVDRPRRDRDHRRRSVASPRLASV
ncbi:hypothetical protein ALC56_14393 [Trachymyrmex septentrionalis]|uniref:Uncharacterized protein n=1 Tax=Trachymyrmex septentrionalis TaxID=34720 RepID=A0A195EUD6_9HYME|nr:hypothetical protein ALC56_14393 [Trachymyrmex septentrionalis]